VQVRADTQEVAVLAGDDLVARIPAAGPSTSRSPPTTAEAAGCCEGRPSTRPPPTPPPQPPHFGVEVEQRELGTYERLLTLEDS
jgi:hypothetical protein